MNTNQGRRAERGRLPLQVALAFAISTAVALVAGSLTSQWASAGNPNPLHGISFAKGCVVPTIVGDTYKCNFLITNNVDQASDTLTITSLVDVVHANPSDVSSGNVLSTLDLGFLGGASCNGPQTQCTLPVGASIFTSSPLEFYTTDATDPNPLTDDAVLTWQDTCSSGAVNCPVGNQTITTGSQSPLYTQTPTNTPTDVPTDTPTNTPTATVTPPNTATNTPPPSNTPRVTNTPPSRREPSNTPRPSNTPPPPTPVSSVAPATVAPPTQVPGGITLPPAGDGSGGGGTGMLVGLLAGIATFGLLLVMGRARMLRAGRYRGRP
jgi:hypothetical protein